LHARAGHVPLQPYLPATPESLVDQDQAVGHVSDRLCPGVLFLNEKGLQREYLVIVRFTRTVLIHGHAESLLVGSDGFGKQCCAALPLQERNHASFYVRIGTQHDLLVLDDPLLEPHVLDQHIVL
jgi:hypothetical protein